MKQKGFPSETGQIIPTAVDTTAFQPVSDAQRVETIRGLGLKPPVLGFVGRLIEAKGLDVLSAALDRVAAPWNLLVVGSGPYEKHLSDWAAERGWANRICIRLARHDEVPQYIGAMDLLLAPSQTTPAWKEQFGRMIIEAFACRVPVVASDSGEIPYVIGYAGIVLPERDESIWAQTIEELITNEQRRRELAEKGYLRCKGSFSLETVAEQYLRLYHDLCAQPPSQDVS